MLPKISAFVKSYEGQNTWIYFLIDDNDLFEKYNTIWNKFSAHIKKEFDSEPACNKNFFLKPKKNLTFRKLQIFRKNKFLKQVLIILV